MILFKGKVGDMTYKELFIAWYFGRRVEVLEPADFNEARN